MANAAGGARQRPGDPGHYFRLPSPAAVSTLATLTSRSPAAGGAEKRRNFLAAQRGVESGAREGGGGGAHGEAGPTGWVGPWVGGAVQASVQGRHAGQPKCFQVRGGEWTVEPFQTLFRSLSGCQSRSIIIIRGHSCSKMLEILVTHLYF